MKSHFIAVFLFFLGAFFSQKGIAESTPRSSGFYIGPSLGVTQLLGNQALTYFHALNGLFGFKSTGHHATLYWGGMVGYHLPVMEKSFVEGEVYYVHQNNQATFSLDNNGFMYVSMYLKKKYSYGASLSLGTTLYEGTGVMPLSGYIRLGIERGAIQNKRRYDGVEYTGLTFKGSENFTSFAPGVGLKLNINQNAFLKLGYVYVFPHSYNIYLPYTTGGGGYYNHKFRHSEQRIELSFGYQF